MKSVDILAGLLAMSLPGIAASAKAEVPAAGRLDRHVQRHETTLAEGWRFAFGPQDDAVTNSDFDDDAWEKIGVPHSWNRLGSYGAVRSPQTDNRQALGFYRLTMQAPPAPRGGRQYLDFAAVSKIADVWVNGVHVGQHKGGFGRFRFDVTPQWRPGAANTIVVRADNQKVEEGSATAEVIPLLGDFFVHGGIYRAVTLITAGDAGFDLLDHGGPGIYARTAAVGAEKAQVVVLHRLRNLGGQRAMRLSTVIRDADGNEVSRASANVDMAPGASEETLTLQVPQPRLWEGTSAPYLYSVTAELSWRGAVIDRVTQPLGIRTFRIDPDKGFFLNGRPLKLHGVSRHQDRPDRGWALTPEDHAQDMALIQEMGANTIRHAHYQHADEWSDEADRAGMVVWAELPYISTPSVVGGKGSPELWANAEQQLRELIRQSYNHPSIAMWSVGNEVDIGAAFGSIKSAVDPIPLLKRLNAVAKEEDPYRPTTFADCCEEMRPPPASGESLFGITDLIGYNRYFGWYYPGRMQARAKFGAQLDTAHARHPRSPVSISEYGAGGATSQHSDDLTAGFLNAMGKPHPEEYLSWYHEQNWPAIRDRDFVFASWVWNMFDFASDLRAEGDSFDLNDKGLVTADRTIRKDAFYYYKAQWSAAPTLHLTGKRHADRAYAVTDVKAYSNADRATLMLNGRMVGEAPCPERICLWPAIRLQPGRNLAVVTAEVGGRKLRDEAVWNGPQPLAGVNIDVGDIAGSLVGERRFGSDTFVTGGTTASLNPPALASQGPARRKVAADDPGLYDYWREGERFSYAIPVADGRWTVTVHTFEPGAGAAPANRSVAPAAPRLPVRMTVTAQGRQAAGPVTVGDYAGGEMKGSVLRFPVTVRDGVLRLEFAGVDAGKALVAAIEVQRR